MTNSTIQRNVAAQRRPRAIPQADEAPRPEERSISYLASLDKPLLIIVGLLLVIGAGMVFSTTFNWSLEERGTSTAIFLQDHLRNVLLSGTALVLFSIVDYRFWRRFAPILFLFTMGALVAVWLFGDTVFNARRSLIDGRFQPGELAEFTTVMYMAAWLGARRTRVDSFFFGLVPFGLLIGILIIPILAQPDYSTVAIIVLTSGAMYFVAGARIWHLIAIGLVGLLLGVIILQTPYARTRVDSYLASRSDPTQANYHTQQVIIAFVQGGWFGRGLGQSEQKFNNVLPAPHTDSIFAVIGEELGVVGAATVMSLFIAFIVRGLQIARRAIDPYGALLAIGFTLWVAVQALLNIAVMTNIIPSTGLPLPFISYGGSALMVTMIGVGLMLSVSRVATIRTSIPNRRQNGTTYDRGWGDRRSRLSRSRRRRSPAQVR